MYISKSRGKLKWLDLQTDSEMNAHATFPQRHGSGHSASGCPACKDCSGSFVDQGFSFAK